MNIIRISIWTHPFQEFTLPVVAQVETVWEKANSAAEKFGNANDSVRFGMAIVALFLVIGFLAWMYLSSVKATIADQKSRIAELETELRDSYEAHEQRYEELRNHSQTILHGYWGTFNRMVTEFSSLNRVLENREIVMRRPPDPEPLPPPPSQQPAPLKRSAFMPGMRRIPPRAKPEGESN